MGERIPSTLTDTEDEEDRVGSDIVTVIIQEIFEDDEETGVKERVDEDKSGQTSIRAEQDWLK